MNRPADLPGLVVQYGPSGYGNHARRHSSPTSTVPTMWNAATRTRKAFLQAILLDMGIRPATTLSQMVDQIAEQLSRSSRPDRRRRSSLLDKSAANVLTDLYNASQGTLILIGEERVPGSMAKLERLHNRVLEWVPASRPASTTSAPWRSRATPTSASATNS
ncbi:hypothetical protein P4118_04050 [Pseudomonas aeruginosa]|nr:hypothetical protein [Pseudomonas aeruginosa]